MPNPNKVRDIWSHIVKNYSEVSLYIDIMHANGIMYNVLGSWWECPVTLVSYNVFV